MDGGFADKSAKPVPPLVHAHSRNAQRMTFRHLSSDPCFYFRFNPRYGMCGDFDAHWEQAVPLQFVELGLAKSSSIDDPWKPK